MATFKIYREVSLPTTLEPYAIYFIAPPSKPNFVEIYVTDSTGTQAKRVIQDTDVQSMIDSSTNRFYPPIVYGDQSINFTSEQINSETTHYFIQPLTPRTVNIPETNIAEGKQLTIVNMGSSTLELLVDDTSTNVILTPFGVLDLHFANAEWHIILRY